MLGQCMWPCCGIRSVVSLQKLIVVPLPCWLVLDHFKKRVKCWECHWMLLGVACSHGINALSDGTVYSLTHNCLWNAKQNADSIARSGFHRCWSDLSWQMRCLRMVQVMGWRWSERCLLNHTLPVWAMDVFAGVCKPVLPVTCTNSRQV